VAFSGVMVGAQRTAAGTVTRPVGGRHRKLQRMVGGVGGTEKSPMLRPIPHGSGREERKPASTPPAWPRSVSPEARRWARNRRATGPGRESFFSSAPHLRRADRAFDPAGNWGTQAVW